MDLEEIDIAYDDYVSRKLLGELTELEMAYEKELDEKIRKRKVNNNGRKSTSLNCG